MKKIKKTLEELIEKTMEKDEDYVLVLARAENREDTNIEDAVVSEMNAHICISKFIITKDNHLVALLPVTTKWTEARDTYKHILAGVKIGLDQIHPCTAE